MHCKCLVFLLIVFFFFSFFSRACEFRFIERMGAHGKQNPDFIIIITLELYDICITLIWCHCHRISSILLVVGIVNFELNHIGTMLTLYFYY